MTKAKAYPSRTLRHVGPQRVFKRDALTEIAFPLGGIGTGTVALGGRGNLRDFEIFGRPHKGNYVPFTFFALWAKPAGGRGKAVARILEAQVPPPYRHAHGAPQNQLQGVARFENATFSSEYPAATVTLTDPAVPVRATLRAWNPFIPLNVHDSAMPVAIFEWTFTNTTKAPVEISLAASMSNPVTSKGEDGKPAGKGAINRFEHNGKLTGVLFGNELADANDTATGTMALATTWDNPQVQTRWYRGAWWDRSHLFWDRFSADGSIQDVRDAEAAPRDPDVGSIAVRATIPPGRSVTVPIFMTWHFPKMVNDWLWGEDRQLAPVLDLYVGRHFANAWSVAEYVSGNLDTLREKTARWQRAMFDSTLPDYVIEAITSQASIMRSPTCFMLSDGRFFGWEGCNDNAGCCHGNCTHVWNYEQSVAFLFPELERTMRQTEFIHNTRDTGNMGFRTHLPPGVKLSEFKPAADGQMGTIIQVYRDWKLCGDDAFLKEVWPGVKRALEYAWTMTPDKMDQGTGAGAINTGDPNKRSIDSLWDPNKDGVMEGEQHNTYDIEFFGPNTLCTAMYLGALKAAAEIADHLGEPEKAAEYRAILKSGQKKVDAELWNGDFYVQKVNVIDTVTVADRLRSPVLPTDCGESCECKKSPGGKGASLSADDPMPKYQYGEGCLSDQLLGQWAAHVAGLGYVLDPKHVKKAVKSIFQYNFRSPIGEFDNVQRVYALNEEAGLLLCSWPRGNRPALPFVYSDEVWTGIEFHVAAHLIYEGCIDEGLTIVKGVTDRYAGKNRNPWNHLECGHHYARAMSSWSVKLALDGFTFDATAQSLGFAPKLAGAQYQTFWSTGSGWGTYSQKKGGYRLEVLAGEQSLRRLEVGGLKAGKLTVTGPAGPIAAKRDGKAVVFERPVELGEGEALEVKVS